MGNWVRTGGLPNKGITNKRNCKSILVICQELFEEDFDMFFRKKGNFNRPSVYFTYNRMSVRLNIIFGVQLFAGVQLVFGQQSKNES
ncbi:MAG: hypothetical protein SO027_02460, partial [[Clostridium] symbiosum]|nr:hypothetical protein [[Clostridium] symbiosum]